MLKALASRDHLSFVDCELNIDTNTKYRIYANAIIANSSLHLLSMYALSGPVLGALYVFSCLTFKTIIPFIFQKMNLRLRAINRFVHNHKW